MESAREKYRIAQAQHDQQRALNLYDRTVDLAAWAQVMGQAIETKLAALNPKALQDALAGLRKTFAQRPEPRRVRSCANAADRAELTRMLGR